jgi:RHS repeat-associated protein
MVDANGNWVVEYKYDAWGKLLSTTGTLANTLGIANPYRYRGYRYDTETGLYLTATRYYDPVVGRFISPDTTDVLDNDFHNMLENNLYAYCFNNPVNMQDEDGTWPKWVGTALKITAGVAIIAGLAVATVATGGAAAVICGAALSGAIAGGASGAVFGAVGGAISGGGWQGALDGAANGFLTGTIIGGITGAASAGINIASGSTQIVGNAHGSVLHKLSTNMQAGKMAASGQYSQIGLNKSLNTMGLKGTLRPDVIGIGKNGVNKLVEVVSPKQSSLFISNKMGNMLLNNPGSKGKIVQWVGYSGKLFR